MTIQETFPVEDVNLLRSRAIDAWAEQLSEEPAEGWHVSSLDLRPFMAVFEPLSVKPGYVLRAYQYRYHRDGQTMVWALPATAVFPPPDPESEEEPPPPEDALTDVMAAIQGNEIPWSYLCASILAREISEVGTFGHGSEWIAHHLLKANPLETNHEPNHSPNEGPTGTLTDWKWAVPQPESWMPSVYMSETQVTVTFYTYCGLDIQEFVYHMDTYQLGSYVCKRYEQVVASGPNGYIW